MALTASKIHLGAMRIFAGVTAATSGAPPTYTTHTNGVPASGTEVGLTEAGSTEFNYVAEQKLVEADQALGYVQTFTVSERSSITCVVKEQTYFTLQQTFNNVGKESVGAGNAFWFGGGTSILTATTTCVMMTAVQPLTPTKYIIVQLYKCALVPGGKIPFSRTNETMYTLTFVGLQDLTRTAGDYMGYYRYEL